MFEGAKWLWLVCLCAVAMLALGCDDPGTDDDDTGLDDDDDDDDGDDDADPCAPEAFGQLGDTNIDPVEPYVHGQVLDATGTAPLAGMRVVYCLEEACIQSYTDAEGRYWFDDLGEGLGDVFVAGNANMDGGAYTSIVAWLETPQSSLEVPDILLPEVDPLLALESGLHELDVGDGLIMELDADGMDWTTREPCFGAVEIPAETLTFVQLEGIEFLAAWGFHGYANEWPGGTPVSFPVRGELACDQPVQIYAMDKDNGEETALYRNLIYQAAGHHDCDQGLVVTDEGEGVELLTWLAYGVEIGDDR